MDSSGYLILHPSLLEEYADVEHVHIVTREEHVAIEMMEMNIMKLEFCIDYTTVINYTYWRVSNY